MTNDKPALEIKNPQRNDWIGLLLLLTSIFIVWLVCVILLAWSLDVAGKSIDDAGMWGDSTGALNTLFSGFAFAGVIWAIKLQRDELRETREQLKGQKENLGKQVVTMQSQAADNLFFQRLRLFTEGHKQMHNGFLHGRSGLEAIQEFIRAYEKERHDALDNRQEEYEHLADKYSNSVENYLNRLRHIMESIHDSSPVSRKSHAAILSEQLSKDEQMTVFRSCQFRGDEYGDLVKELTILRYLDTSEMSPEDAKSAEHFKRP